MGMKYGRKDPKDQDSKEKVYKVCYDFSNRFEKEFGSCYCYDLIECHLDNEEERQNGWRQEVCKSAPTLLKRLL